MRGLTVLLTCLGLAAAAITVVPTRKDSKVADKEFLTYQKKIFELLSHVTQPTRFPEITKLADDYHLEADLDKYSNVKAIKEFWMMYKNGMLPKGKIFTISNHQQRSEAIALFHVFYYAKDFETFYNAAAWARENMNAGMFVYSLTVAVLHRKDTQGIVLPPIYEIYPYFFVNNDVIQIAQRIKMQRGVISPDHVKDLVEVKDNLYVINANYSGWYVQHNPEQRLSYFTEDIGLNSYYYYFHTDYPYWMAGEEYGLKDDRRGELYYFVHQQLLARYHLERLTNDLGKIPTFSWRWPIKTGFYPSMKYHNGLEFPVRSNEFDLATEDNLWDLKEVEYLESRMRDIVSKGFIELTDGTKYDMRDPATIEIVGQLIQQTPNIMDKVNYRVFKYYAVIARTLLGTSPTPINDYNVAPSVLEQYETSLRDPVFWQLYKRIVRYFILFKHQLTPYTQKELLFDGVTIDSVNVERLVTYFDTFKWDITNGVFSTKEELKGERGPVFFARQPRLNHKPFDVTMSISSNAEYDAVIRIFMGPKFDSHGNRLTIDDNHYSFVELDTFLYRLASGKNTIVRNSRSFWHTVKDRTTTYELYKAIMGAQKEGKSFELDINEMHNGFPQRLLLPKGTTGGFPFQLYIIVSPWIAPKVEFGTGFNPVFQSGVGTGARFLDNRALGYPLDRTIRYNSLFHLNNMYWKDVPVYLEGQDYTLGEFNFHATSDYTKNLVVGAEHNQSL